MASTYVNDLRLNEMATGDESGNWGVVTNLNLELIGEALSFGTEAITTNADTHTTTVADGAADPGRAMYLKYTGTLDSACTITIAPNTISRMHFIENGTSGSQNIIISQGSGANITIPAGDTKAVYLDGAGSGAAVVDAFASLSVVDLKVQDDLTVTDDLIVGGDIDLEGAIDVNGTANLDVVDIDGAVDMATTLTLAGNADFNGDLDVDGTTNLDAVDIDGAVQLDATLTVGVDDTGYDVKLFGATSGASLLWDASADDLILAGAAGLSVQAATVSGVFKANGGVVFNEDSADLDFRIEGNGQANLFVVNGGTDDIGIGIANPTFSTGNGMQFADNFYLGFGTGNGTRPDFSIHGDNNGLGFACGTGSDDTDITFDTSGNLGVGVTSPAAKIHVSDTTSSNNKVIGYFVGEGVNTGAADGGQYLAIARGGAISQVNSVNGGITLGTNVPTGSTANIVGVYQFTNGRDIRFLVSDDNTSDPSLRMLLKGSGQFCVGLTSPGDGGYISVVSNGGEGLFNGVDSTNAYRRYYHTVSDGIHRFKGSANTATLSNAGAWGDASDIAYKKDIVDTVYGLDTVKQFQPRDFVLKADETNQTGFIAQEMETVCPQFVVGEEGTKTINYGQITSVLTKAIQELETRVATLEG